MRPRTPGKLIGITLAICACDPSQGAQGPLTQAPTTPTRADACREDIPDCSAVCALRETRRTDFIDFYERRCAAVILGRNPDKIELQPTPYVGNADGGAPSNTAYPPEVRASLMIPPAATVFDPSAMPRTGGNEPAECKAARILRAQRHDREAETMEALCLAKGGGDAGL